MIVTIEGRNIVLQAFNILRFSSSYTAQSGGTIWISRPPETRSEEPVMLPALAEAKKAAASPTPEGV